MARMADRPARARIRRSSLGAVVVITVAATLPALTYGDRTERPGNDGRVSARVHVAEAAPAFAHGAEAPLSHGEDPGWVYSVTPGVETEGRGSIRIVSLGSVVRIRGFESASTRAVLRQLEPFAYTDLGDGMILIDRSWVGRRIVTAEVPVLGRVRCHEAMIPQLAGALTEIEERGLAHLLDTSDYGGCWVPRRIDWSPHRPLSNHAWGLAIDINVSTNQLGRTPLLDRRIVDVFERWGFGWGGDWSRPDGMHFELVSIVGGTP